jgi:hypothetical protein
LVLDFRFDAWLLGVDELADKFAQQHFYCFGRYAPKEESHGDLPLSFSSSMI